MRHIFLGFVSGLLLLLAGCAGGSHAGWQNYGLRSSDRLPKPPARPYDWAVLSAIDDRWHALIKETGAKVPHYGLVVVSFRVQVDGRVSDVDILRNTEDEVAAAMCRTAILSSGPFNPMPAELRRKLEGNYRGMTLSFYYQ